MLLLLLLRSWTMQTVHNSNEKKTKAKNHSELKLLQRQAAQTGRQHVKKSKGQATGRDRESACLSPGYIQSAIYDEI